MRLYLVRHGIAAEQAPSDGLRALTAKGRARFRRTARALGDRTTLPLILTSPLVRAVQTAEILAAEAGVGEVRVLEELAPGHAVEALLAAAARAAGSGCRELALVGHEPQLSGALAVLVRLPAREAAALEFRKGAVVRLDVSALPRPEQATARFWLEPGTGRKRKGLPLAKGGP